MRLRVKLTLFDVQCQFQFRTFILVCMLYNDYVINAVIYEYHKRFKKR